MRLINATWDTRSLGVPTLEIGFGEGDGPAEALTALDAMGDYGYVVAKVPTNHFEVASLLQRWGFRHIESSLEMVVDLARLTVGSIASRFEREIRSEEARGDGAEAILKHVEEGVFDTDRIYLDPHFGHDAAARRYANWIRDELAIGSTLHSVFYRGNEVGFFVYKERVPGVEAYPFLAGVYPEWRSAGFGANVVCLEPAREAQRRGCRRIRTYVSSNNMPVIRAHLSLGYRITSIHDVFVLHADEVDNG